MLVRQQQQDSDLFTLAKVLTSRLNPKKRQEFLTQRSFGEVILGNEVQDALLVSKCATDKSQALAIATLLLNAKIITRVSRKRDKFRAALTIQSASFKAGNRLYRLPTDLPSRIVHVKISTLKIENLIDPTAESSSFSVTMQVDKQRSESKTTKGTDMQWDEDFQFVVHPGMGNTRIELALWKRAKKRQQAVAQKVVDLQSLLTDISKSRPGNPCVYELSPANITADSKMEPCCSLSIMVEIRQNVNPDPNVASSPSFPDEIETLLKAPGDVETPTKKSDVVFRVVATRRVSLSNVVVPSPAKESVQRVSPRPGWASKHDKRVQRRLSESTNVPLYLPEPSSPRSMIRSALFYVLFFAFMAYCWEHHGKSRPMFHNRVLIFKQQISPKIFIRFSTRRALETRSFLYPTPFKNV